ncbi:DUF2313 domain-containing protein [Cellulosilyticum sp. ST5]|uniref:putative phage tail protein n=1 Tax=Cellulosilyticum sp. ST5 TaxID=3055805 RepID=UPI003977CA8D
MRLKKYLPEFIDDIKEFQELDATISTEIDELREKILQLQDNQFIESANSEGLSRYEKIFSIPYAEDVATRRFNILNKYNSTIPFTLMWLTNMLNTTLGRGNFLLDMNYNQYTLTISVLASKEYLIETLYNDLRKKIPCNLVLNITTLAPVEVDSYVGVYIRAADTINM